MRTVIGGGSGVVLMKITTSGDETEKRRGYCSLGIKKHEFKNMKRIKHVDIE